jgi:hypothetical protein
VTTLEFELKSATCAEDDRALPHFEESAQFIFLALGFGRLSNI